VLVGRCQAKRACTNNPVRGVPATIAVIVLGALAAMLPDPLQFGHSVHPHEPLATLQRFHRWIHTKRQLKWPLGISSQIIFAAAVIVATGTLH
jgi:hypothetical protein